MVYFIKNVFKMSNYHYINFILVVPGPPGPPGAAGNGGGSIRVRGPTGPIVLKRFQNPLTLNAIKNEEMNFLITVPEQTIMLIVSIEGPNGNVDFYMKRGEMPTPVCSFKNILLY